MASLSLCVTVGGVGSHRVTLKAHLHNPTRRRLQFESRTPISVDPFNLSSLSLSCRSRRAVGAQERQTLFTVFASKTNPPEEESVKDQSVDTAQGPPFLTILAGFIVFLLLVWVLGSVITSLFGLFVKLLPPK